MIQDLKERGVKNPKKIREMIEKLIPEVFSSLKSNNIGVILNMKSSDKFKNVRDIKKYLDYIMGFDERSREVGGQGISGVYFSKEVKGSKLVLSTFSTSSFSDYKKFNIELYPEMSKGQVDKLIKEYIKYYIQQIKKDERYRNRLTDYIKSTGGHRGNPVWMD